MPATDIGPVGITQRDGPGGVAEYVPQGSRSGAIDIGDGDPARLGYAIAIGVILERDATGGFAEREDRGGLAVDRAIVRGKLGGDGVPGQIVVVDDRAGDDSGSGLRESGDQDERRRPRRAALLGARQSIDSLLLPPSRHCQLCFINSWAMSAGMTSREMMSLRCAAMSLPSAVVLSVSKVLG